MNSVLRRLFAPALFVSLFISCKTELEKLDINNLEAHRAYQDTIMNRCKTDEERLTAIKKLISEYAALNKDSKLESNVNYNYYMARAYWLVNSLSFPGFWIDSTKKVFKNKELYTNYYDSSNYFAEKTLELDSNYYRGMSVLSLNTYFQIVQWSFDKNLVPDPYKRNAALHENRLGKIVNTGYRFLSLDTTKDKRFAQNIGEVALWLINNVISDNNYTLNLNDQTSFAGYIKYGEIYDEIKSNLNSKNSLVKIDKEFIESKIYPNVIRARAELTRRERVAEEERVREEVINSFDPRLFEQYYEMRKRSEEFIKFDRNGTYTYGSWDVNNFGQKVYKILKKDKFQILDNQTILLKNYFDEPRNDLRMRYSVYSLLGVENPLITALRKDGSLYDDLEFWSN